MLEGFTPIFTRVSGSLNPHSDLSQFEADLPNDLMELKKKYKEHLDMHLCMPKYASHLDAINRKILRFEATPAT